MVWPLKSETDYSYNTETGSCYYSGNSSFTSSSSAPAIFQKRGLPFERAGTNGSEGINIFDDDIHFCPKYFEENGGASMKRKFLHEMSHFICGNEDLKGWTQDGGYVASPWDAYYYGGLDKPGKEGGIANDAFGVFSSSVDWLDYY